MTVFADPEYVVNRPNQRGGITLFGKQDSASPGEITAIAATKNNTHRLLQAHYAERYITDLDEAKALPEQALATVGSGDNRFSILGFGASTKNATMLSVKFEDKAKKGFLCVINLRSVGKTQDDIKEAKNIPSSWLQYFWDLWNTKATKFSSTQPIYTPLKQTELPITDKVPTAEENDFVGKNNGQDGVLSQYRAQLKAYDSRPDETGRNYYLSTLLVPVLTSILKTGLKPAEILKTYFGQFENPTTHGFSTYLRNNITLEKANDGNHNWFGNTTTQEMIEAHSAVATELRARVWENFMNLLTNLAAIDGTQAPDKTKEAANHAWTTSQNNLKLIDEQDQVQFADGNGLEPFPLTKIPALMA